MRSSRGHPPMLGDQSLPRWGLSANTWQRGQGNGPLSDMSPSGTQLHPPWQTRLSGKPGRPQPHSRTPGRWWSPLPALWADPKKVSCSRLEVILRCPRQEDPGGGPADPHGGGGALQGTACTHLPLQGQCLSGQLGGRNGDGRCHTHPCHSNSRGWGGARAQGAQWGQGPISPEL